MKRSRNIAPPVIAALWLASAIAACRPEQAAIGPVTAAAPRASVEPHDGELRPPNPRRNGEFSPSLRSGEPQPPTAAAAPAEAPPSAEPSPNRATECAPGDGEAPVGAADEALAATAAQWVDALARRDVAAASRFLPTMNCGFEKSVADCRRREALRRDEMLHVAEGMPSGFAAGRVSIRRDAPTRGSATVLVHPKADPCGSAVPVTIVMIARKPYVDVAISRSRW